MGVKFTLDKYIQKIVEEYVNSILQAQHKDEKVATIKNVLHEYNIVALRADDIRVYG